MIWSGLLLLGYVGYQTAGTNYLNRAVQEVAQEEFLSAIEEVEPPPPPDVTRVPTLAEEAPAGVGEVAALLRIPSIGLTQAVFEGTDPETLKLGPGRLDGTAFPGQPGNAVLSGHRTTYGAPFFALDNLVSGDEIIVQTAVGTHTYAVRETLIVMPTDIWVAEPREGAWLTLTTCNPIGSARERLIVFAEMTDGPNLEYILALDS